MSTSAHVFAVVGAESTGKTTLVAQLHAALSARGLQVAVVPEFLRSFCDQHGRTPRPHEQADIARTQTEQSLQAAATHDIVLVDTTALMTAIYSELLFGDTSLYPLAEQAHQGVSLSLLTALDLPWVPDGLQRDGPHVRRPVDDLLRAALRRLDLPHATVAGQGEARLHAALGVIDHVLAEPERRARQAAEPTWRWVCAGCDDGDCERHSGWLSLAVARRQGA